MSAAAIIMMCVALCLVWGGLVLALIHLKRHPESEDDEDPIEAAEGPGNNSGTT